MPGYPWDYKFEIHESKEIHCQICGRNSVYWKLELYPDNLEKYDCVYTCNMECLGRYLKKKGFNP